MSAKWEYLVDSFKARTDGSFDDWLNARGNDGWELVKYDVNNGTGRITATFKRPKR